MVALNTSLTSVDIRIIARNRMLFYLETVDVHSGDATWVSCDSVINSAGLWAGNLARMFHSSSSNNNNNNNNTPQQYFAKGTYFRLQGNSPNFQQLIYPVPEPGGLGVHATIGWNVADKTGSGTNAVKFGPDVEWLSTTTDPDDISYLPDPARGEEFYAEIAKYWPGIMEDGISLQADYIGVRPKLSHPGLCGEGVLPFQDFYIAGKETHFIPGLIHLMGMESPGLTSSMAVAEHVSGMLLEH
ncbi:MAG: hypothetical protein SGARI_006795 [Bacillariaceae sp.]